MRPVVAPAKLTLSLAVTGVRADGLHELRSEMVALSLADELRFTEGATAVTFDAQPEARAGALGGGGNDLITRALAAVGRRAAVHVVKRIPLGGGLGGGSADAAAVLRWAGCADPGVALALGSDVPFCLAGGRALVEGVGERVTPLPYERREFLLLIPPFGVDTARVYATWDELERREEASVDGPNALVGAALMVEPRLAEWRERLGALSGQEPVLAGSGSTWFVEGGPAEAGTPERLGLAVGEASGVLLRAHTVPVGWEGGE